YDRNANVSQKLECANAVTTATLGDDTAVRSQVNALADPQQDRVTRLFYDARNRVDIQIDPMGAVTRFQYDAAGNVTLATSYANTVPPDNAMRVWYVPSTNSSASKSLGSFN